MSYKKRYSKKDPISVLMWVLIGFVLYFFFKSQIDSLFSSISSFFHDSTSTAGATISDYEIESLVAKLDSQFNNFFDGGEDEIVSDLSALSEPDYNKLRVAFGTRRYSSTTYDYTFFPFGSLLNLNEILSHELSQENKDLLYANTGYLKIA